MAKRRPIMLMILIAVLIGVTAAVMAPTQQSLPDPEDADRYYEAFQCSSPSPQLLAQLGDIVSYSGDTMLIKARTGETIEFKSFLSDDEVDKVILFCVKDYFEEEGILILDTRLYEDPGFTIVNINTGETLFLDGMYTLSPDRKRLLHESYFQYELHFIQIMKITPLGLVQEQIEEANNAFRQCTFTWTNNDTIAMNKRTDSEDQAQGAYLGRILRDKHFWRYETNDAFSALVAGPFP